MPMGTTSYFVFIDGVQNGGGGEQGDFVLSAAPAKKDADSKFFHDPLVWMWAKIPSIAG